MTILVTGATGNVGRHVVNQLVKSGQRVRALTRNPAAARLPEGVEVVYGDLTLPETLVPVMEGVKGIHLMTSSGGSGSMLQTGTEIVEIATKAGVRRVTMLWSGKNGTVEEAVKASNLEWTLLQPSEYMSNTLLWAESIRTESVVQEPFGDALNAFIHEADVGAVAATALVEDGHAGKTYTLTGPEALTVRDKVRIIGLVLGRNIQFSELTNEQARERMKKLGVSDDMIEYVIEWHENPPKEAYTVVPTVKEITGKPARTFAQWVEEHIKHFI